MSTVFAGGTGSGPEGSRLTPDAQRFQGSGEDGGRRGSSLLEGSTRGVPTIFTDVVNNADRYHIKIKYDQSVFLIIMRGEGAVLISAVMMGTLPFFIKSLSLPPVSSTFYRMFFGAFFVGLFLLIRRERPVFSISLVMLGLFNVTEVFLYITAITHLSAAMAALLLYMAPIYVMVYSIFQGRISKNSVISLVIGIAGLYLLLLPEKELNIGLISGILSGVAYAGVFIMLSKIGRTYSPIQITFSNLAVGMTILVPFFRFETGSIPLILGLGLIPTAIPFILLSYGMARVRVEKGPIIALIEPVTAGMVGYLAFSEILSGLQLAGAAMILSAVFIALNEKGE